MSLKDLQNNYYLFLDDERYPPKDGNRWVIVRCYEDFVAVIQKLGLPKFISFDHDLGEGENGYACARWLVQNEYYPIKYYVHSQNPIGKQNIEKLLESWEKYKKEKDFLNNI